MDEGYQFVSVEKPDDAMWTAIGGGIDAFNQQQAGDDHAQRVCSVLYGPDGSVEGGVIAEIYWDWLYINLMWIAESLRDRGYGARLLAMVEDEARRRGAKHAFLDTFSFQAPGFYEKQGYHVFGELPDFPAGHRRFFMTKEL